MGSNSQENNSRLPGCTQQEMKKATVCFLVWAIFIYLFCFLGAKNLYFDYSYESSSLVISQPNSLWHLASYDGVHYLEIASLGYFKSFLTAFFPIYPILIKLLGLLLGNQFLSSIILSFVFTYLSVIGLYRLGGLKPVILLLSFPLSFFLLCSYTESLFLSLTVWSYIFYKKGSIWPSILLGSMATATRVYGAIFLIMILYLAFKKSFYLFPKKIFLMSLGLLGYMTFLYLNFHDPIAFFHNLSAWGKNVLTFPPQTIFRYLKILVFVSPKLPQYYVALLELSAAIFGSIVAWYFYRTEKIEYLIYVFLGVVVPMMTGTLQSLPRYLVSLFPIYMVHYKRSHLYLLIPLSLCLQFGIFYAFLNGIFVS